MEAGAVGHIVLFDKSGFLEALKSLKGHADEGTVKELKDAFTGEFSDEGWASPSDVSLPAIKNSPGYLTMMASRRATNRAKRLATGCGLTSVEEMDMSELTPEEARKVESEIIKEAKSNDDIVVEGKAEVVTEPSSKINELFDKIKAQGAGGGRMKVWEAKIKGLPEEEVIRQMEEELSRG
jgi:polyhydroxyalkanoate synthesis regulator phasin